MNIQDAVVSRRSVRDFLPAPVVADVIRRVIEGALRAPSGGNLQPWHLHVVGGDRLAEFKQQMAQRLRDAPDGEPTDYDIYPRELTSPYRDRRSQIGELLYARLGIPREDKAARKRWFARNFQFFGAPLALFCSVERSMGPPQWSDLGMLLQTVMLLLRAEGLDSCAQECWALYPRTVESILGLPSGRMLFCGMAIGYADEASAVNQGQTPRAPVQEQAEFLGI